MGSATGKQAMAKRRTRAHGGTKHVRAFHSPVISRSSQYAHAVTPFCLVSKMLVAVMHRMHSRLCDLESRCAAFENKYCPATQYETEQTKVTVR